MQQKSIKLQLAVAVLVFIWAYSWVVMKQASLYISPAMFTALRGGISFLVLYGILLCRRQKTAKIPLAYSIGTGLFQITGMQGLSQLAVSYGNVGKISVLAYTMPIWLTLFSGIFLRERIKGSFYILTFFVIGGMVLLIHPWNSNTSFYSYFFALLSGLSWAYGCVLTKKLYAIQPDVDLMKLTAWQMLVTTVVCGVTEVFIYHPGSFIVNTLSLYTLFFNGVIASAGGWLLLSYILKHTPTGKSHISLILVPVVGLFLSWLILHERLTIIEFTGIVLIVAMCILNRTLK